MSKKEVLYTGIFVIGAIYFITIVIPDMHKIYLKQFIKAECMK